MSTWHVTARKQHCDQWQVAPGLPHLHHCPFVNSVTVQPNALGALGMDFTVNSILQLLILSKPLCFWHLEKFRSFITSKYTNICVYLWEVRASLVAQLLKNSLAMQETPFDSWVRKIPCRRDRLTTLVSLGFPDGSDGKESAYSVRDLGLIPGLGRSPGGGHGNPLQYSCLESPHGQRSLEGYSPWGRKESDTTEQLSTA